MIDLSHLNEMIDESELQSLLAKTENSHEKDLINRRIVELSALKSEESLALSTEKLSVEDQIPKEDTDVTTDLKPQEVSEKENKAEAKLDSETTKTTPPQTPKAQVSPPDVKNTEPTKKMLPNSDTQSTAPIAQKPVASIRPGAKSSNQTEASKIKETILNWCIEKTQGYENVQVSNFSSSWNNGMAFCALVHHFCPDAFDFKVLNPKNRKANFELAFKVAEDKCDISPLLEAEDMILMGNKPDARCVFTYLSTFYQKLELLPAAKAAAEAKRNEA